MDKRRHKITFQRLDRNAEPDEYGKRPTQWVNNFYAMASYRQQRATETDTAPQTTAAATYIFETFVRCDKNLTTDYRILLGDRVFNITAVNNEYGRNRKWIITAVEDVSPRNEETAADAT